MLRTEGDVTRPCSGTELLNASSDAVYLGEVDKSVLHEQFECKPAKSPPSECAPICGAELCASNRLELEEPLLLLTAVAESLLLTEKPTVGNSD